MFLKYTTSPMLWIKIHHITAVYITPQTLDNFIVHHFIIIHSHPVMFHIIIQK